MDKLKQETLDITADNINKIGTLFPNVITETKDENGNITKAINFDKLKQELSSEIIDNNEESYDFTWVGKNEAIVEANTPIRKTLRPCIEESKDFENTENLYIEGDNLDVLKLLQESYLNSVKMIYIDPPYNTGKDFIYKDNFHTSCDEYDEESGVYDEDGNIQFVQNNDANPRFHSDWCSMIYARLKLAKNLLTDDGVIFISIDDNEVDNLKKICNEIFGESNFVANIVWEKVHTRKNSAKFFSISHEHILCYAKFKKQIDTEKGWNRNLLPRDNTDAYKNPDNDIKGRWKADPITAHNFYDANYKIHKPNGVILERPQNRYWVYSEQSWNDKVNNNEVIWGEGNSYPMVKRYLSNVQNGLVPITIFSREFAGDSSLGNKDLANTLNLGALFTYPKPVKLLLRLMQIGTNSDDIILDFFSGSATTAHAVMQLNAEDGGNRKFIMVQLPEECDEKSEAFKAGYKNICEIGKERIRRAGEKIKEENGLTAQNLDTGFRVLKLDDTNMKDVYYGAGEIDQTMLDDMVSNIKDDRTDLDLLYGVLLDWGLQLSSKHEILDIEGVRVHNYDDGSLVACFEEKISESVIREIAKLQPLRVVFRDSSFTSSPEKINVEEIFKLNAPNTSVKVI